MMNIAQAVAQAAEAGKSGISVFLDAGLIGLILTNSGLLIKALIDRKAVKKEKATETQPPCLSHHDRLRFIESLAVPQRLATLEANALTTSKTLDDIRKENREDHRQLFGAISNLREHKDG